MFPQILYGCTIVASSLLLFLVQPMLAKAILPWFGGSAGVWTSAIFFFQAVLVMGYFYAWWTTKHLRPIQQWVTHAALLAGSLLTLPIVPKAAWKPMTEGEPAIQVLELLAVTVGMPYFLLSATGPLVQVWFARRSKDAFPYRLFALSNLASLAALLAYPAGIEPWLSTRHQLTVWSAAYAVTAVLIAFAGFPRAAAAWPAASEPAPIAFSERLLWFALSACPSVLWLATANTLSQSIAPIPFLWILALGIYLLSLILCFDRDGWYRPRFYRVALPASWLLMAWCTTNRSTWLEIQWTIVLLAAALFVCCMFCHGELARRKPDPARLTAFWLTLALGGASGGLFVGLIAPQVFRGFWELPAGVAGCVLLAVGLLYGVRSPRRLLRLGLMAALGFVLAVNMDAWLGHSRVQLRNFYGVLRVSDQGGVRILSNGATHHGAEFLTPENGRVALTYYGRESGIAAALRALPEGPRRVGVIGLGTGTLAVYARPGDSYRFYEINPAVIQVAQTEFDYLRKCAGEAAVTLGDARLALEREPPWNFDLLAVDAFSGDSIPIHLLTAEAFQLYRSHLKPNGILAVHITNRYLDLQPVVVHQAEHAGMQAQVVHSPANESDFVYDAIWVLAFPGAPRPYHGPEVWTDDFSNLLQALK